jgi:hypothetical protein
MYIRIANIPITLKIKIITLINISNKLFKGKYDMSKSEGINNTHSHIIMSLNSFLAFNISFNFLYSPFLGLFYHKFIIRTDNRDYVN